MRTRRKNDPATPDLFEGFTPHVMIPTTVLPGARPGEWEVRAGKPIVLDEEINTREFARLTGLSQRHVVTLCDEGRIQCRRKSPKRKSEYLIPRAEAARFRQITETEN